MVTRFLKIGVAVGLAALLLGMYLGNRLPYGDTHLRIVEAKAKLEDPDTGLALADSLDGDQQFAFNVHQIKWSGPSGHGDGEPPCLRKWKQWAEVEIGYISLATPDGTTYHDQALWIRCG